MNTCETSHDNVLVSFASALFLALLCLSTCVSVSLPAYLWQSHGEAIVAGGIPNESSDTSFSKGYIYHF